jgi:hypothetical protein
MDSLTLLFILITILVLGVGGYFVYQDRKSHQTPHEEKHA